MELQKRQNTLVEIGDPTIQNSAALPAIIISPNKPGADGESYVEEAQLTSRYTTSGSEGTNVTDNNEYAFGKIHTENVSQIIIDGTVITKEKTFINTDYGTLRIIDKGDGSYQYRYKLKTEVDHSDDAKIKDVFQITVVNSEGQIVKADLNVNILDDAPIGAEDGVSFISMADGMFTELEILENDQLGADGATVTKFQIAVLKYNSDNYLYETIEVTADIANDGFALGNYYFSWDADSGILKATARVNDSSCIAYNYTLEDADGDIYQVGESIVGENYLDYFKADITQGFESGHVVLDNPDSQIASHAGGFVMNVVSAGTACAIWDDDAVTDSEQPYILYENATDGSAETDNFYSGSIEGYLNMDYDGSVESKLTINDVNIYDYETGVFLTDTIDGEYGTLHLNFDEEDIGQGFARFSATYIEDLGSTGDMDTFDVYMTGVSKVSGIDVNGGGDYVSHSYLEIHQEWELNYVLNDTGNIFST